MNNEGPGALEIVFVAKTIMKQSISVMFHSARIPSGSINYSFWLIIYFACPIIYFAGREMIAKTGNNGKSE